MAGIGLIAWLIVAFGAAAGCKDAKKKEAPPPIVEVEAPDVFSEPPPKPTVRRRLPSPLAPGKQRRKEGDRGGSACQELVNQVCALLSEGAEECAEARTRLARRPQSVDQPTCKEALNWYRVRVEEAKRKRPCRLLAEVKCGAYGEDSMACAGARADVTHMSRSLPNGCEAELLLFKGLP